MKSLVSNNQIKKINYYWQDILDYIPHNKISASQVISENSLQKSNKIVIYHINEKSFIKVDPFLFDEVNQFIEANYTYKAANAECLSKKYKEKIHKLSTLNICYLGENNFIHHDIYNDEYYIRPLTSSDVPILRNLEEKYSDKTHLETNSRIILGCFEGNDLVAAAGLEYLKDNIANIITLPASTLLDSEIGKLLIRRICISGLSDNKILQYKFSASDLNSKKIADIFGFKTYVVKETLTLNP